MPEHSYMLNGVKLPANDLLHMIEGGGLPGYEGRDYLEAFLEDEAGHNVLIFPQEHLERIFTEHKQMQEILEQEHQLLKSYGLSHQS